MPIFPDSSSPVTPGTDTVLTLIDRTRRAALGQFRGKLNKVKTTCNTSDTNVLCQYVPTFGEGAYLSIDDEVIYVYQVDKPTSAASSVERAQLGTIAAQHTAGTVIEVEPRFPKGVIRDALQEELRSWPPSVYRTVKLEISPSSTSRAVDLVGIDSTFLGEGPLNMVRSPKTNVGQTSQSWPRLAGRVERNMKVADFSSTVALFLEEYPEAGGFRAELTFAMPFSVDTFTDATFLDSSGVGLEPMMYDIPALGAASKLLSTREIKRTFTESQGEARRAAEVPPQFIGSVAMRLRKERDQRLEEVSRVLAGRHPLRGL